jgi:hypothetical protein
MDDFENGLCQRINDRIKARGFCVVYDHELSRICAPEAALRERQIRVIKKFAAKHGRAVSIREVGINATFKKRPEREKEERGNGKNGQRPVVRSQSASGARLS